MIDSQSPSEVASPRPAELCFGHHPVCGCTSLGNGGSVESRGAWDRYWPGANHQLRDLASLRSGTRTLLTPEDCERIATHFHRFAQELRDFPDVRIDARQGGTTCEQFLPAGTLMVQPAVLDSATGRYDHTNICLATAGFTVPTTGFGPYNTQGPAVQEELRRLRDSVNVLNPAPPTVAPAAVGSASFRDMLMAMTDALREPPPGPPPENQFQ